MMAIKKVEKFDACKKCKTEVVYYQGKNGAIAFCWKCDSFGVETEERVRLTEVDDSTWFED